MNTDITALIQKFKAQGLTTKQAIERAMSMQKEQQSKERAEVEKEFDFRKFRKKKER